MSITIEPIGIIRSPFETKENAPIHGAFHPEVVGTVEVYPEYAHGLTDIEGFSHLILDRTPLIDIKPYVAKFDSYPDATEGWLKDRLKNGNGPKPPGRE